MEQLLAKVPQLRDLISYFYTAEDMFETEEYIIKDLSSLTRYRDENSLIVADVAEVLVEEDRFSQIVLQKKYNGSLNYKQIYLLKQTLVHVIRNSNQES